MGPRERTEESGELRTRGDDDFLVRRLLRLPSLGLGSALYFSALGKASKGC